VLACLATTSRALAEDRAGKTNKFTRKEIGQFFKDYPDMLKLVYKAMNIKCKAASSQYCVATGLEPSLGLSPNLGALHRIRG